MILVQQSLLSIQPILTTFLLTLFIGCKYDDNNNIIVVAAAPSNDRCVNALPLVVNVPVIGNNVDANFDYINPNICGMYSDRRGVWYNHVGSGYNTTISLCLLDDYSSTTTTRTTRSTTTTSTTSTTTTTPLLGFGIFQECNTQICLQDEFALDVMINANDTRTTATPFLICQELNNNIMNQQQEQQQVQVQSYTWSTNLEQDYFVHVRGEGQVEFAIIVTVDTGPTAMPSMIPSDAPSLLPSMTPTIIVPTMIPTNNNNNDDEPTSSGGTKTQNIYSIVNIIIMITIMLMVRQ